jgi:hypothetical protein
MIRGLTGTKLVVRTESLNVCLHLGGLVDVEERR